MADGQARFGKLDPRKVYFRSRYFADRKSLPQDINLLVANQLFGVQQFQTARGE